VSTKFTHRSGEIACVAGIHLPETVAIDHLDGMTMLEKIILLLDEKGWSQTALERATGLSRDRISKWKNGQGEPTARNARDIARVLGVPVDYLVDEGRTEREERPLSEAEATALKLVRTLELREEEVIRRLYRRARQPMNVPPGGGITPPGAMPGSEGRADRPSPTAPPRDRTGRRRKTP
jgi:transcriptional regulator with XRE-family HTH domain